ncbi:trehalase family glycosidase [Rhodobacter sp. KR11]|uniref:MGH1-like glycoside hydrolase domain-containing protein n=1 Tax=Rhodobacter sp. KR11 TaxID=2974588 RepID=UPI0022220767|nr:trehalase family glycosidase [Rhodobacter sp. KR11]MCW1920290.1 trehalase family glycosidase [Rhodobacter sp. KR11]
MLKHLTIPQERAWNSWSDLPGEMVFLPLGLRVTPVLYSSRTRNCALMAPRSDKMRLGRHALDGSLIEWQAEHGGTLVDFRTTKPGPFAVRGSWEGQPLEWGLRFWVTLALHTEERHEVTWQDGAALVRFGDRWVALVTDQAPVQVTGHADLNALCQDYAAHGYFHRDSRAEAAPLLALRFNLEMSRAGAWAAAVADSRDLALAGARAALVPGPPAAAGDVSYDAIRDIVGWNTIWDGVNARPFTAVTRIWNLGTWAVWHNDQTYAALLAGVLDLGLARENLAVALSHATPQGNFACIATSRDTWVDRSQPPLGSLIAWNLFQRSHEISVLKQCFDTMARNQRWWRAMRGHDGLISCGTSDVGEALYKGTAFGARNETGMDNSATHDEAVYDADTRSLSTWDLGLNCAVCLDAEMLALMAGALGRAAEAAEFAALAASHRALIRDRLWDADRQIFANRQRQGGFVRSLSPTSFYPLLCGAADAAQTAHLMRHLADPATFGGDWGLPNATRDDPAFAENVYWRGRIWPNVNYLVWLGLRRAGQDTAPLATMSRALFLKNWQGDRIAAENYSATTGAAMDQGDTDPFYIWAGLLPLIDLGETVDFDPWRGLILRPGAERRIGPLVSPWGRMGVDCDALTLTVTLNDQPILATSARLEQVILRPDRISARAMTLGQVTLWRDDMPVLALWNGEVIRTRPIPGGLIFDLTGAEGGQFDLWFS